MAPTAPRAANYKETQKRDGIVARCETRVVRPRKRGIKPPSFPNGPLECPRSWTRLKIRAEAVRVRRAVNLWGVKTARYNRTSRRTNSDAYAALYAGYFHAISKERPHKKTRFFKKVFRQRIPDKRFISIKCNRYSRMSISQ